MLESKCDHLWPALLDVASTFGSVLKISFPSFFRV
ncbi:hypothetical protein SLEP1_g57595 [Rubroshorea leprosula]|uniref:Uncharacterized protein n=1 Tax=Rubroshorea leprosula TaxID=152421 RepID=A0AAV5MLP1_9ROSI|nr:hypothetical protein SLEP1_g57595 [Rubroshorea leprosula]